MLRDHPGHTAPPPGRTSGLGHIAPIASCRGRIRSRETPLFKGLSATSRGTGSCSSIIRLGTRSAAPERAQVEVSDGSGIGRAELAGR